jgi:predicted short-subunit dehydrogenase-like oxidoreductase (DUF2520 family)
LTPFNVSIVGAGRVGSTLAVLLHRRGHRIAALINRTLPHAQACGAVVSCDRISTEVADVPAATDLLIIATPERAIESIVQSIVTRGHLEWTRLAVCHTSGPLTSDLLSPLAERGAMVFSLHPIQTFPRDVPLEALVRSMDGISYGFEGPSRALPFVETLVRELGGRLLVVPKDEKISYHLACVFASNFFVAVLHAVEQLAFSVTGSSKLNHFRKLIESSINHALEIESRNALTGPIARGSDEVVRLHLAALHDRPDLQALYRSLASWTLRVAESNGSISPDKAKSLKGVLENRG